MYQEEIITLIKTIKEISGKQNKELAADLGITPTRLSTITRQGDMKLSTFIRLLDVSGLTMEIGATDSKEVIKVYKRGKCAECTYKHIVDEMEDGNVKLDEKTSKIVIEV